MNAQCHILVQMPSALMLLVLTSVFLAEMGSEAGMGDVMVRMKLKNIFYSECCYICIFISGSLWRWLKSFKSLFFNCSANWNLMREDLFDSSIFLIKGWEIKANIVVSLEQHRVYSFRKKYAATYCKHYIHSTGVEIWNKNKEGPGSDKMCLVLSGHFNRCFSLHARILIPYCKCNI